MSLVKLIKNGGLALVNRVMIGNGQMGINLRRENFCTYIFSRIKTITDTKYLKRDKIYLEISLF